MAETENRTNGAYHLADNPNLYEVQRSNNFVFVVTGLGRLLRASALTEDETDYIDNVEEVIRISARASSVPHFSQETIEVRRGNSVVKYAGVPSFSDMSVTLDDFIGADTKSALMAWQRLSYDSTSEKVGYASSYKKDCELIEYAPDNQTMVRYYELKGCWISGISEDNHDNDSTGKRAVTATIQYDKAFMKMPD